MFLHLTSIAKLIGFVVKFWLVVAAGAHKSLQSGRIYLCSRSS